MAVRCVGGGEVVRADAAIEITMGISGITMEKGQHHTDSSLISLCHHTAIDMKAPKLHSADKIIVYYCSHPIMQAAALTTLGEVMQWVCGQPT